jgi:hypothetical protein
LALKDNNTISGFHIKHRTENTIKVHPKKYNWHIPKALRHLDIQPGDIVRACAGPENRVCTILVMEAFREDIEVAGKTYKPVVRLIEKAPQ